MIKRTLYFGNPARLFTRNEQIFVSMEGQEDKTVPIEDVGYIIIDNDQISLSKSLIAKLTENNTAIVITNSNHMPAGIVLPLDSHTLQQERSAEQLSATIPLKKRLWQQIIKAKIRNQALILAKKGSNNKSLIVLIPRVRSGDPDNIEALAAQRYWKMLFEEKEFVRSREGGPPNNLLNYGYAILRAIIARSLTGAGLLPLVGIFHKNRYNAYPLADDIMEPYRPFVDELVYRLWKKESIKELTKEAKQILLTLPQQDVKIKTEYSSLMIAASHTAVSLYNCFAGNEKIILFPEPCR